MTLPTTPASQTVAILLCTFRGEAYLARQLDTILAQTHDRWVLYVSDDGSDDGTKALLQAYQARIGEARLRLFDGPRQGFAANFFSLIARPDVRGDCYAFTDQDDEWDPCKLERAVAALSKQPRALPALYGSASVLIDAHGRTIGHSRLFTQPPSFANALVQNMVSGNTMVLNDAALALIRRGGTDLHVSAHDWWAYLLVTGYGGVMVYDTYPTIRYRQHGANLYGANVSWRAMWTRVSKLLRGDFRHWNAANVEALRRCWPLLDDASRRRLELFDRARRAPRATKLFHLLRAGVYRQTWDGQLGLFVAALGNRI